MPCRSKVTKQTEFDFFQQLKGVSALNQCCGPITTLGFTPNTMIVFARALEQLKVPDNYLDVFEHTVVDSTHILINMCARHWIRHAVTLGELGQSDKNEDLVDLAEMIYQYTCVTNEWDYKEILNYMSTLAQYSN